MEVNKPGGPVAPTAPVHFFQSLLRTPNTNYLTLHATCAYTDSLLTKFQLPGTVAAAKYTENVCTRSSGRSGPSTFQP